MDSHDEKNQGNVSEVVSVKVLQESCYPETNSKLTRYSYSTQSRFREEEKMKNIPKQMNSKADSIIHKAKYDVNSQRIDKNLYRRGIAEILLGLGSSNQKVNSIMEDWKVIDRAPRSLANMEVDDKIIQTPADFVIAETKEKETSSNLLTMNQKKNEKPGVIKINKNLNESESKVNEDISSRIDFKISNNFQENSEFKETGKSKERPLIRDISPWKAFKNKGKFRYNPNQPSMEESSVSNFMDSLKSKKKLEETVTAKIKSIGKSDADRNIKTKAPVKRINETELFEDEKPSKKYLDEFLLKASLMKKKKSKEMTLPQSDLNLNQNFDIPSRIRELKKSESQIMNIVNYEDTEDQEDDVINIEGTYNYFHPLGHSNSLPQLEYKFNKTLSEYLNKEKDKRQSQIEERKNEEIQNFLSKFKKDVLNSKTFAKESLKKLDSKGRDSRGGIIDLYSTQTDAKKNAKNVSERKEIQDLVNSRILTKRYEYHNSINIKHRAIDVKDIKRYADPQVFQSILKIQRWWRQMIFNSLIRAAIQIQKVFRGYLVRNRLKEYSIIFNEIGGKIIKIEKLLRKKYLSNAWEFLQDYEKPSIVVCKNQVDYFKLGFKRKLLDSNYVNFTKSAKFDFSEKIKLIQGNWSTPKEYKLFKLMRNSKKIKDSLKIDKIVQSDEISIENILKKELVISSIYIQKKITSNFVDIKVKKIQNYYSNRLQITKNVMEEKVSEDKQPFEVLVEKTLKKEHAITSFYMKKSIYSKFADKRIKQVQKAYSNHRQFFKENEKKVEFKQVEESILIERILIKKRVINFVNFQKIIRSKFVESNVKRIQLACSNHLNSLKKLELEEKEKNDNILKKQIFVQKVIKKENFISPFYMIKRIYTKFTDVRAKRVQNAYSKHIQLVIGKENEKKEEIKSNEEITTVLKFLKYEKSASSLYIQKTIRSKFFDSKVKQIQKSYSIHSKRIQSPTHGKEKVEEIKTQEITQVNKVTKIDKVISAIYLEKKICTKFIDVEARIIQKAFRGYRTLFCKENINKPNEISEKKQEEEELHLLKIIKKENIVSAINLKKIIYSNISCYRVKKIQKAYSNHLQVCKSKENETKEKFSQNIENIPNILYEYNNTSNIIDLKIKEKEELLIQNTEELTLTNVFMKEKIIPDSYIERRVFTFKKFLSIIEFSKDVKTKIYLNHIRTLQNEWLLIFEKNKKNKHDRLREQNENSNRSLTMKISTNKVCYSKQIITSKIVYSVNTIIKAFRNFRLNPENRQEIKNLEKLKKPDERLIQKPKIYFTSNCLFTKSYKLESIHDKTYTDNNNKTSESNNLTEMIKQKQINKNFSYLTKDSKSTFAVRQICRLQYTFKSNQHLKHDALPRPKATPFIISKKIVSFESLLKLILIQRKFKKLTLKRKINNIKKPKIFSRYITKEFFKILKLEKKCTMNSISLLKRIKHEVSHKLSEKAMKIQKFYRQFWEQKHSLPNTIMKKYPQTSTSIVYSKENLHTRFISHILFLQSQTRRFLIKKLSNISKKKILLQPLKISKKVVSINSLLNIILFQRRWKRFHEMKKLEKEKKLKSEKNISFSKPPLRKLQVRSGISLTKNVIPKSNVIKGKILYLQRHLKQLLKKTNKRVHKFHKHFNGISELKYFTKFHKFKNSESKIDTIDETTKRHISENIVRQRPHFISSKFSKKIVSSESIKSLLKIQKAARLFLVKVKSQCQIVEEKQKEETQIAENENLIENDIQIIKIVGVENKIIKLPIKTSAISICKKQIPLPTTKIKKIFSFLKNNVKLLNKNKFSPTEIIKKPSIFFSKKLIISRCGFTKEHNFSSSFVINKTSLINKQVKKHLTSKYESQKPVRTIRKNVNRSKISYSKENDEIIGFKKILYLSKFFKNNMKRRREIPKIEIDSNNESLQNLKKNKNFVFPKFFTKSSLAKVYKKSISINKIVFLQNQIKKYLKKNQISLVQVNKEIIVRKKLDKNYAFITKDKKSEYIKKIIDKVKFLLRRKLILKRLKKSITVRKRGICPINLIKSKKAIPLVRIIFIQKIIKMHLKKRKASVNAKSKPLNFYSILFTKEIVNEYISRNIKLIQKSIKKRLRLQKKQRAASEIESLLKRIRKQVLFGTVNYSKEVYSNYPVKKVNFITRKFKLFKKNFHILRKKSADVSTVFSKEIYNNFYPEKLKKLQLRIKRFLKRRKDDSIYDLCEEFVDYNKIKADQIPEEFLTLLKTKIINSIRRDIVSDINEIYTKSQLKLVACNTFKGIFSKPFFTLNKFVQLRQRVSAINLVFTVKQNLTKHIQEVIFRKLSQNFSHSNSQFTVNRLADNSSTFNKQNHYYKTIKRFKKLLNSPDDDRGDIKNKEIVFKHLESIYPKNYVRNYYGYKWWDLDEKNRDEETLGEAYLFYSKGDPKLLRFMEFVAKKEKNLKNMRNFFIARINKIKILYNSNIFALANVADQLYIDLNSKYLCHTCYCKEGEENEKFNDQYYCNCECHLEIRELERSMMGSIRESARESEAVSLNESIDIYSCNDLSKSKMDYDEDMEEDHSIQVKLKLKKKEKKNSESIISSSNHDEFLSRISSRPSKKMKIDNLFKKVADKSFIQTQEDKESIKSLDEVDEYSRTSVVDEESKKSLFREFCKKSILDLSSRRSIHSFQSIDIDSKKITFDDEKRRTDNEDILMKKHDDEYKKRLLEDEFRKSKFDGLSNRSYLKKTGKLIPMRSDTETKANMVPTFTSNKNKIPTIFSQTKSNLSFLKKNVSKLENKLVVRDEESLDDLIMTHKI